MNFSIQKTMALAMLMAGATWAAQRPNIVVFMVDDLGWNHLSVKSVTQGTHKEIYATPNLEMLAEKGLTFAQAYAQPNCAPTRAAMLSGQYPARVHNDVWVVEGLNRFSENGKAGAWTKESARFRGPEQSRDVAVEAVTVAEALQQNGYATAHIGKYHAGGHDGKETLPENAGFDINIGGSKQGHQGTCFASKTGAGWGFKKVGSGAFDPYAEPYTFDYVRKYGFPETLVGTPKHITDALSDSMEKTIRQLHAGQKPFYLQFHTYAVHGPVQSRPDLMKAAEQRGATAKKAKYAGFVSSVDVALGRMLMALEDPNGDGDAGDSIAANTLILFTSDNGGTHDDNLPLKGSKGMFTEGGIRVPLIAYWPGVVPANQVTDHLVHCVDYYPTLLELAGDRWHPASAGHPLDGESFAGLLRDPASPRTRDAVFYLFPGYMDARAQPCAVVIDDVGSKRYKLYYYYESDSWELYCLTDDQGEADNIIAAHVELARGLSKKIHAWLNQKHPTWNPKYPLDKKNMESVGPPPVL